MGYVSKVLEQFPSHPASDQRPLAPLGTKGSAFLIATHRPHSDRRPVPRIGAILVGCRPDGDVYSLRLRVDFSREKKKKFRSWRARYHATSLALALAGASLLLAQR